MSATKQAHSCPGCDGPTTGYDLPCCVFCIQRARDRMEQCRAIVAKAAASVCRQVIHNGPTGLWVCQRETGHDGPCWEVGYIEVDLTGGSTETADREPLSTAHEQPAPSAPCGAWGMTHTPEPPYEPHVPAGYLPHTTAVHASDLPHNPWSPACVKGLLTEPVCPDAVCRTCDNAPSREIGETS